MTYKECVIERTPEKKSTFTDELNGQACKKVQNINRLPVKA